MVKTTWSCHCGDQHKVGENCTKPILTDYERGWRDGIDHQRKVSRAIRLAIENIQHNPHSIFQVKKPSLISLAIGRVNKLVNLIKGKFNETSRKT